MLKLALYIYYKEDPTLTLQPIKVPIYHFQFVDPTPELANNDSNEGQAHPTPQPGPKGSRNDLTADSLPLECIRWWVVCYQKKAYRQSDLTTKRRPSRSPRAKPSQSQTLQHLMVPRSPSEVSKQAAHHPKTQEPTPSRIQRQQKLTALRSLSNHIRQQTNSCKQI